MAREPGWFPVYLEAMALIDEAYRLRRACADEHRGLAEQIRLAAIGMALNLGEHGRRPAHDDRSLLWHARVLCAECAEVLELLRLRAPSPDMPERCAQRLAGISARLNALLEGVKRRHAQLALDGR